MPKNGQHLGKLIGIYPASALHMQRATFISVLSFIFFLAMMFAFYTIQSFIYFLLATAFLIIYLVTMFGLFTQKRSVLKIFEHGFSYKTFTSRWDEVESVESPKPHTYEIRKTGGELAVLSGVIDQIDQAAERIKSIAKAHR
jgi:hypothetical protein